MKIAIHNSFIGKQFAETELVRRICIAAENLGWEAKEFGSALDIKEFRPDFVLVTHFNTPKLSEFPTYGCMWSPPVFFDKYEEFMNEYGEYTKNNLKYKNIFSYDAYLSSSPKINDWLENQLQNTVKDYFIGLFFTSCNLTQYVAPDLKEPHLVYIGSNWDGKRFKQLFKKLDTQKYMEVYGANWGYLKKSYKGILPFDGISVLDTIRQSGVGLCLHRSEHQEAETPSMRIFEIVASGALAICGEHQFIRNSFGNNVLYIDTNVSISEQVQQISNHINWIKNHHQEALEMSKVAHKIFAEKYSLEKLLLGIVPHHQNLVKNKGFIESNYQKTPDNQVQFIVRVGDRSLGMLKRCLNSIVSQTHKNVGVILVKYKEIQGLTNLLQEYEQIISIKVVNSKCTGFRSTQLYDGINSITSNYFAILDDDDVIHPNHVSLLVLLLEKYKFAGVAYSGAIKCLEDSNTSISINKDLAYFEDFDLKKIAKFKNFVTSNSFIARSTLISDIYKEDPELVVSEDFFLILKLCQKSIFVFSYEVTCEFYWRVNNDNATSNYDTLTRTDVKKVISGKLDLVTEHLSQMFENESFIYIVNDKSNSYLHNDIQAVNITFSELRYSKPEKLLGAVKGINSPSPYNILRSIYLKLSKGGKYNKNPSILSKFLVHIKKLLLE